MQSNLSETIQLTIDLIQRDSVTPVDKGCQIMLAERLANSGFNAEYLRFCLLYTSPSPRDRG